MVEHSWLDTMANVSQSLVSLFVLIMLVMAVALLYALRRSIDEVAKLARSAQVPLHAAIGEAREVTKEVRVMARSLRAPLALAGDVLEDASDRLRSAMDRVDGRLSRFDALVEIAQGEAEGAHEGGLLAAAIEMERPSEGGRRAVKGVLRQHGGLAGCSGVLRHAFGRTKEEGVSRRRRRRALIDENGDEWDDETDVAGDELAGDHEAADEASSGSRRQTPDIEAPRIRPRGPTRR